MKILTHARAYSELLTALPALGITLSENQSIGDAIKARLAAAAPQPSSEQIEAATMALLTSAGLPTAAGAASATAALSAFVSEFEQVGANLATAQASLTSINTALAKSGVQIAPDAKPADIEAAIAARISTRSAELLAQTGTPQVEVTPSSGSTTSASKVMSKASFDALSPAAKMSFSAAGGRLTE